MSSSSSSWVPFKRFKRKGSSSSMDQSQQQKKGGWSYREKLLFFCLILIVAAGQFRTMVKAGSQMREMWGHHLDSPSVVHDSGHDRHDNDNHSDGQSPSEKTITMDAREEVPVLAPQVKESASSSFIPLQSATPISRPLQQEPLSKVVSNHLQEKPLPDMTKEELASLETFFYRNHREKMASLFFSNKDSYMIWLTRDKEHPYQAFWSYFPNVYKPFNKQNKGRPSRNVTMTTPYLQIRSVCGAAKFFQQQLHDNTAIPHVLMTTLNENWGAFSEEIPGKTTNWAGNWREQGCTRTMIWDYLNHPLLRAVITTQFQSIDHPKVHSLPLGLPFPKYANFIQGTQQKMNPDQPRSQLLMINHKRRPMRNAFVDQVIANFNGTVQNTHGKGAKAHGKYFEDMIDSKFILSPGGLGFDCYRIYEALYLGTIPILEHLNRTDGWFRTFVDLPVAWIDSYDNLTPEFLEKEYVRIIQKAKTFKYEKLTKEWWIDFIKSHVKDVEENLNINITNYNSESLAITEGPASLTTTIDKPEAMTDSKLISKAADNPQLTHTRIETFPTGSSVEEAFYLFHKERIQSLVNKSSAIVWDTRSTSHAFLPLWEHFDMYRPSKEERKNPVLDKSHYLFWGSICSAAKAYKKCREAPPGECHALPHVHFFRMNENWGGFSQMIPGKTAAWVRDLEREWKKEGCSKQMLFDYLDHPDTLAAFTVQFQEFHHPKVRSIPLGILNANKVGTLLNQLGGSTPPAKRTQLLMINNKPRPMRDPAVKAVIQNFDGTVRNTYGKDAASYSNYWVEMKRSKFILSPGGLGMDCYRHWEAIVMGTIPVLETLNRTDAWFQTFDDLPVAWVDFYENLTPEYLEKEYERIISKPYSYKYEKLTKWWWVDYIKSFVPNDSSNQHSYRTKSLSAVGETEPEASEAATAETEIEEVPAASEDDER